MSQPIQMPFVQSKIILLRGHHIMLDRDLAELYGVPTMALNQAVKRNKNRFPPDFMFQLSSEEFNLLRSQFVTSNSQITDSKGNWVSQSVIPNPAAKMGMRLRPYAFTEQGVAMLSGVLRSERATEVNIAIMRSFVEMRRILLSHSDLAARLDKLESKYDQRFQEIFGAIRALMMPVEPATKPQIGFVPHLEKKTPSRAQRR